MVNPLERLVDLWCFVFGHSEYLDLNEEGGKHVLRCRHCKAEAIFDPYGGKWAKK